MYVDFHIFISLWSIPFAHVLYIQYFVFVHCVVMIFFIMIETNKYVQIVLSCSCIELPCIYQIQWHYLSRTGI